MGQDNSGQFIFISSGSVYTSSDTPCAEDDPHKPLDFYNLTKSLGEQLCKHYRDHLDITIIRPFFPFGPGAKPGRLIDNLYDRVLNGQVVTLNEGGTPKVNPIYIDDLSAALVAVIECKDTHPAYNFGGPEILTIEELALQIGEVLGKQPIFESSGKRVNNFVGDIARLRKIHQFGISFNDALIRTIAADNEVPPQVD